MVHFGEPQPQPLPPPPLPRQPPPPPPPPRQPPPPLSLDSPLIIYINEMLKQAGQYKASSTWATLSIYRVPKSLRDVDRTAYTPKIVSLGPYHHERVKDMDHHKWRALQHALARAGNDVRPYLDAARSLEDRARACYEAPLSISSDDFVQSLVLDSIFALELFRGVAGGGEGFQRLGYDPKDPVFASRGARYWIQIDMIMLENQLPLFVLDSILSLQLSLEPSPSALDSGHKPSPSGFVASLALRFFDNLRPTEEHSAASFDSDDGSSGALHCLDVFYRSLIEELPRNGEISIHEHPVADKLHLQLIHCVTELHDTGIEFQYRKSDRFWNITFKDGVLHIPRLLIQDGTKSLFHNLMAFEECHLECSNRITSYVIFMNCLIKSEVDVVYLRSKKIINHFLGKDGDVADMFNQLCKEVVFNLNESYISELSRQVNDYYKISSKTRINYYKVKCQEYRAILRQKLLSSPWAIISLIAAGVLLLLTAAQTFYTVYDHYKPKTSDFYNNVISLSSV